MFKYTFFGISFLSLLAFQSCSPASGNNSGHEYMPDMGHPVSIEGNFIDDYSHNHWEDESTKSIYDISVPRKPVAGTVPRGYAGIAMAGGDETKDQLMKEMRGLTSNHSVAVPINGSVSYKYKDTEEERTRAKAEITKNPYVITKSGLAKGKELYNIYCGICHGEKGGGNGYLYEGPNAKYPAAPANLVSDQFIESSEGRFYHAIMYGLNAMGSYSDKLSYEERWQVIHYIRSLQADAKKAKYDENENTLNNAATPGNAKQKLLQELKSEEHPH